MRKEVEDAFLEWQISLPMGTQDQVVFHNFDSKLSVLFVRRLDGLEASKISELEAHIKRIHPLLLVSSVRIG